MSRIKLFEEYTRTVGFRYSEPTIEIKIQLPLFYDSVRNSLENGLVVDTLKKILEDESVKVKSVETLFDREYDGEDGEDGRSPIREALYVVSILVYNEKEIDSIIDRLVGRLTGKYGLAVDHEGVSAREA